jgi:hypothetical protein
MEVLIVTARADNKSHHHHSLKATSLPNPRWKEVSKCEIMFVYRA